MKATVRERMIWISYACFLVLLFLMSSTDLIIKEEKSGIYRISVIIEDNKDDYYANFRKGMDQAAIDYNIDVSFFSLYERNQWEQQKELVTREINDGAQAIVLTPADQIEIASMLDEIKTDVPFIVLNSYMSTGKVAANVSIDYYEAGRQLAEAVAGENAPGTSVYLFTEGLLYGSNARYYDGIISVLQNREYKITLVEEASNYGYQGIQENLINSADGTQAAVALDSETLTQLAQLAETAQKTSGQIRIYGPGVTMKFLNYVDREIIQGLTVTSQYAEGYLSMEKAVEAVQKRSVKETLNLDHFYLEKEDIVKKEYEKILYPID